MLLFLILLAVAHSTFICTGVDEDANSFCQGKNKDDCDFYPNCEWTNPSASEEPVEDQMWFANPTNQNGNRFRRQDADLGRICHHACGRNCTSTGRVNATDLTEVETLDVAGYDMSVWPGYGFTVIVEIECKYLDQGCHGGHSCGLNRTPEECTERPRSECFWVGDHPFAQDTGCDGASNSSAGYVFIIMGVGVLAMLILICVDGEIQEAIFEKKIKATVVFIQHLMFNLSSCYGLYSALHVMATLSCLNDALEGFSFTDCNDKLDDIAHGATLVFVGSVMSLLMLMVLSGLHKFGLEDLLEKEETSLSVVCLEAFGKHGSKFFMFIGCFVGMHSAKDEGFWGAGCQGDFQESVDEEYQRFYDTLMIALGAMLFDILYFVKEYYFPDVEMPSCCGGDSEAEEKEGEDVEAQTTFETTMTPLELTE